MNQEANDEYVAALADVMNSLEEWKIAGAHVTAPAGAIQRLIHAICRIREDTIHEARMQALASIAHSDNP